jgi:O-antigen ligase
MTACAALRRGELAALLVVLAVLVLLPIGRSSELPVLLAALGGIGLILRRRQFPGIESGLHLGALLFVCYWLPIVLSGFAAVAPQKTWMTALETLRFLPFAVFACWALRKPQCWPMVQTAIAAICGLWLIDAWIQCLGGRSLAGAPEIERLSGIFGADNLKLGPVLAVLAPFVLSVARERGRRPGLLLAFVILLVPILLAGSRAAWLCFALVTVVFAWRETRNLRRFLPLLGGALLGVAISIGLAWQNSSAFDARVDRTLLLLHGTEAAFDEASAGRLSIWQAAIDMARTHPLSGVGARGFRYDYAEHAVPGDRFLDANPTVGPSHAHQIVLEVLSETGVAGLLAWLLGAVVAIRAWRHANAAQKSRAFAPGLALAAMCFPLNTHLAFYSAWWGLFFWWLLALYVAALGAAPQQAEGDSANHRRSADQHEP